MKFWDSSAIVPLLLGQAESERMLSLYRDDPSLVVWWGTRGECDSAAARLERQGALGSEAATAVFARLDLLAESWNEVEPQRTMRNVSRRLLRTHALRAGDAMQLSAAVVAAEQSPATLPFVCLDDRLRDAARREGFPLVPA